MHRKIRQIPVLAFDIASASLIAVVLMAGFAAPAQAYVDPSVMTYTIQALAGVAVALSAVLGVAWRRIRRGLYKVLKIDENAGKVKEPAVVQCTGEALEQADVEATQERASQGIEKPQSTPWLPRFIISLFSWTAFCFILFFTNPLEIVATNAGSFQFSYSQIWGILLIFTIAVALVAGLLTSLLKDRKFDVAIAIIVSISLCFIIQGSGLNRNLPGTNGQTENWLSHWKMITLGTLVWVAIIAAYLIIAVKKPAGIKIVSLFTSILLIATSGISASATLSAHASDFDKPTVTKDGLYTVSSKNNVIMLICDYFDTKTMDKALKECPELLDEFEGFTYFHNATSMGIPTRRSVPYLITGHYIDETAESGSLNFYKQACSWYEEDNLISTAVEQGYSVGIYSDSVSEGYLAGTAPLERQTINIKKQEELELNSSISIFLTLAKTSLYKDGPWLLKPFTRYYTDDVSKGVLAENVSTLSNSAYLMNDPQLYKELKEYGLSFEESDNSGAYRIIHMTGDHPPYSMNREAESSGRSTRDESDQIDQAIGSIKIVSEYLHQLKELGVYENATIIVTADHGEYRYEETPSETTTPIFLVKKQGSVSGRIQTSEAATGHSELPATIEQAFGLDVTSDTVFDITSTDRERYFYWNEEDVNEGDIALHQILISGNALDIKNWVPTGKVWTY